MNSNVEPIPLETEKDTLPPRESQPATRHAMSVTPFVHIGYHKTSSTWLQRGLFVSEEAGFASPFTATEITERFVLVNPFEFDARQTREAVCPRLEQVRERGLTPVLSHEGLSGYPSRGGFDSKLIADRLGETFPDARILIVIREQKSMLLSMYKEWVKRKGYCSSIEEYLRSPTSPSPGMSAFFKFDFFEYHRLVRHYQQLFGSEDVLVLPFEMLRTDRERFLSGISRFAGTKLPDKLEQRKVNVGYSGLTVALKRRVNFFVRRNPIRPHTGLNRLSRRFFDLLDRMTPKWIHRYSTRGMKHKVDEAVGDRYKESNRITSELIGIDLREYGYDL